MLVIFGPYAVVDPDAVVIKIIHTAITRIAVFGCQTATATTGSAIGIIYSNESFSNIIWSFTQVTKPPYSLLQRDLMGQCNCLMLQR